MPDKRTPAEVARDAELQRQQDVRDAVARAGREELPRLGGFAQPEELTERPATRGRK